INIGTQQIQEPSHGLTIYSEIVYPFFFPLQLSRFVSAFLMDCVKFFINVPPNCFSSTSRVNSPFCVNEMAPVSSETIMVNASVTSLTPRAARCLVPNSFEIVALSDKGK